MQAISKPVNTSSLEQQQSQGLDTPPGVRLAGNMAGTKAREDLIC